MQNNIRLRSYTTDVKGGLTSQNTLFGRDFLDHIWRCVEKEGLHRAVFYDGAVQSAEDLAALLAPGRAWTYCFERDGEVLSLWWCNGHSGHMAQIHFCVFEAGRPYAHEMGMRAVRFIMKVDRREGGENSMPNESAPVSVLCGVTPAPYRHAVQFAQGLGFQVAARLPRACHIGAKSLGGRGSGRYVDGVLTILKREDCH